MSSEVIKETKGYFGRLWETICAPFRETHEYFEDIGVSLAPRAIRKRSNDVAKVFGLVILVVTLPVIMYHRGLEEPKVYMGVCVEVVLVWLLINILLWIAHFLWAAMYFMGRRVGSSTLFLGYIAKRWGRRIDQITDEFMTANRIEDVASFLEQAEKEGNADTEQDPNPDSSSTDEQCPDNPPEPSSTDQFSTIPCPSSVEPEQCPSNPSSKPDPSTTECTIPDPIFSPDDKVEIV